ncbi:MAG: PQQ-like beta-propeller repeat protein [Ignavibacteriales bacterium]|nr:PQQ-like beta-propeller repeat protein [Ignavibacteriales bacterium]
MTAINLLFKNSRTLKYFIFSLTCVVFAVMLTSCEQNPTAPNEPPKPPGYQEDIYWPSLADSPWPMFRGNPQYTGRSKYNGPSSGLVQWAYDSVYTEGGALIGADNSVIFQTSGPAFGKGGVYSLNQSGDLNWYYNIQEIAAGTTPLILYDSTIIVSTYIGGKIIALTKNGLEKWVFDTGTYITTRGMNIGMDGTIFFQDSSSTLFALGKDGKLKWTLKIENTSFGSGSNARMAFSPDGNMIYLTGTEKAIYAVDVNQRQIIWSYGGKNTIASPLVDSYGNIFLYGVSDYSESEQPCMTKLNYSGNLVYKFAFGNIGLNFFLEPTIDLIGNIYFGVDSLYSLDYAGNLNWKLGVYKSYGGVISSPLTCDRQNIVYVPIQNYDGLLKFKVLAFKDDGSLLWLTEWLLGESGDSPALGIGSLYFPTYRSASFYSVK